MIWRLSPIVPRSRTLEKLGGVFANLNIEVDDLVLCEKPFVISSVEEYNDKKVSCVIDLVGDYHTIMFGPSFSVKCTQKARVDKKGARELLKVTLRRLPEHELGAYFGWPDGVRFVSHHQFQLAP